MMPGPGFFVELGFRHFSKSLAANEEKKVDGGCRG
jgi:hypothetical protein